MTVLVSDEHPSSGVDPEHLRRLAEAVLFAEGFPPEAEVSITLVDDDEMAAWNARALGKTGPTDVLSFPVESLRPGEVPDLSGRRAAIADRRRRHCSRLCATPGGSVRERRRTTRSP